MFFALGFIVGLIVALFLLLSVIFVRVPLEKEVRKIERKIAKHAPRPKGFIIMPEDEATQARNAILENNAKLGKDTPLSELYENS